MIYHFNTKDMYEEYGRNWIKGGMEVAHKDNLIQPMTVEGIVTRSRGDMKLIVGVKCHWWQDGKDKKKIYQFGTFHTRELIPWEVALKGSGDVKKFLER